MYEHYYVFTKYVVEKYDESVADSGGGEGGFPGQGPLLCDKYILLRLFSSRIQLVGRI